MGRKKFFYVAAIFHIVGSIIQLVGNRFGALIVGRILTGATVGLVLSRFVNSYLMLSNVSLFVSQDA